MSDPVRSRSVRLGTIADCVVNTELLTELARAYVRAGWKWGSRKGGDLRFPSAPELRATILDLHAYSLPARTGGLEVREDGSLFISSILFNELRGGGIQGV